MHKIVAFFLVLILTAFIQFSCSTDTQNPKIRSISVTPDKVAANATIDIKFIVEVSDPNGLVNIKQVLLDLDNLGGTAEQEMSDDGTNGDDTADDGFYTYIMTGYAAPSTAQKIEIKITVIDFTDNEASDTCEITIIEPPIVKTFTVSKNPVTPGETITFNATVEQGQYPVSGATII